MTYTARFHGRRVGDIGIFYWIDTDVDADTHGSVRNVRGMERQPRSRLPLPQNGV